MRAVLVALALLLAGPAAARLKIDRYEPATLPAVKLWVSVLNGTRPVPPAELKHFSVYVNGELLKDPPDFETAAEVGKPMALAVVADARFPERWLTTRTGLEKALAGIPGGSRTFGIATHEGIARLPEEGWSQKPGDLPATMREIEASGSEPRLQQALRLALSAFPLREDVVPERDEEPPPKAKDGEAAFPDDRVLYVIGDGELGRSAQQDEGRLLRELIHLARRRGVRVMTIGISGEDTGHLWTLRVLARKTGGTYRHADRPEDLPTVIAEAADELRHRYVLTAEVPGLQRGDTAHFMVRAALAGGVIDETREFSTRVENVLGFWASLADTISDLWEGLPWWGRWLIIGGAALFVVAIVVIIVFRRARKRRDAAAAAEQARQAALAQRRPCGVCGQMMMPDWVECLFCAIQRSQERPMRFRLTGRAGSWAGQALRFDRELITLGSANGVDVLVLDRGVAPQHCGLRDRGQAEFVLVDYNTDTGTWLNGERITQAQLREGDLVRIGESEFVFGVES